MVHHSALEKKPICFSLFFLFLFKKMPRTRLKKQQMFEETRLIYATDFSPPSATADVQRRGDHATRYRIFPIKKLRANVREKEGTSAREKISRRGKAAASRHFFPISRFCETSRGDIRAAFFAPSSWGEGRTRERIPR